MQKKTNLVAVATITQRLGERNEMIVMYPDNVVGLQDFIQLGGKMGVNPYVAAQIAEREFRQVEPVVQDRPEHPVGEAVVVFLKVVVGEVCHHIGNAAMV